MNIEIEIIVLCAVVLVWAIISPCVNIFFRKLTMEEDTPISSNNDTEEPTTNKRESIETTGYPPLSVILTTHEDAPQLEAHLPAILEQDYPADYEVIVVEDRGDDGTSDLLKQFAAKYKRLYVTFIPDSSRYMSRKKLAVTLGVKAAKHEWLIMTEPHSMPASNQWLRKMAECITDGSDLVVGYSHFAPEATDYQRFERLYCQRYLLRESQRHTTYRCESTNLMFRKSQFMAGKGYDGNLKYLRGEYDFLANKYAKQGTTATSLASAAWTIDDAPNKKSWRNKHLYYMETRRHLHRSLRHRLTFAIDMLAMHLNIWLIIAALVVAVVYLLNDSYDLNAWLITATVIVAFIVSSAMRITFAQRGLKQFHEHIATWKILWLEMAVGWYQLFYRIIFKQADKYDFISHKL